MVDRVELDEKNKISVPRLGFGLMRLPTIDLGDDKTKIDFEAADKMVAHAISNGVNYFDTAYMYHGGESELFAAYSLTKYPRNSYTLADKLPMWQVKEKKDIERIFNEQLEKCKTEYFDFYLMHALNKKYWAKILEYDVYEFLSAKKAEGKIKNLGFSFHDEPEVLDMIANAKEWDFAQIQLNYLDWTLYKSKEQYEILTKANIPVIVMEPLRGGSLINLNEKAIEIFKSHDENRSLAAWAFQYITSLENVKIILSGMSNIEQLSENIEIFTNIKGLNEKDYEVLEEAKRVHLLSGGVPCSSCKYCIDCPKKINISLYFSIWNQYCLDGNKFALRKGITSINENVQADKCINCGKCSKVCPQMIDIPSELKKIFEKSQELIKDL